MVLRRPVLAAVGLAAALVLLPRFAFRAGSAQEPVAHPAPASSPATRFPLVGAGSCASGGCHNRQGGPGARGREFALAVQDPHARAYEVLLTDDARKMAQRYRGLDEWRAARPEYDLLCVRCHVHPEVSRSRFAEVDGVRQFRLEDGVSCEACHGAAGEWLARHHRSDWRNLDAAAKGAFGMSDTRSIAGRVRTCLPCHVGVPGMEVNHDLIAAGHPRLAFEFAGYHSLIAHHWREGLDRDPARGGRADFELAAWTHGQLASLDASLTLLADRAKRPTWPELAELDCYSCHHELRQPLGLERGRGAGQLRRSPWYTAELEALARLTGQDGKALRQASAELDRQVQRPAVDAAGLAAAVAALRNLATSLKPAEASPAGPDVAALLGQITRARPEAQLSWDEAAQFHGAVRALEQTRLDLNRPELPRLRLSLQELREGLLPASRFRPTLFGDPVNRIRQLVP